MERQDAIHQNLALPTPGPWNWEIHDHSMATLCGGGEDAIIGHIMSIAPCRACSERGKESGWEWGRCGTPREANARLIAKAPEMLAMLGKCMAFFAMNNHPDQAAIVGKLIESAVAIPAPIAQTQNWRDP
jgi:hypothetical protein